MRISRPALFIGLYFIALALVTMAKMPVFEASDEAAHFLYIHNLLEERALPVIESREDIAQEASLTLRWSLERHQPPLYYLIGAALVSWTQRDDIENYLRPNPLIFMRGTVKDNPNKWLHEPSSAQGDTATAVYTLRLYSLVLSTTTLFLVYGSAKLAFRSEALALISMLFVASIPTFIAIGGSVNNDNLVTLLYSAGVFWSLRMWRYGIKPGDMIIISLILAAAALTKITGLTLFGIVYVSLLIGVYCRVYSWRQAAQVVIVSLLTATVLAGWWYLRNLTIYGDFLAVNATGSLWGREFAVATESGSVAGEISRVWRSFWMMAGHLHYPVWGPEWFYSYTSLLSLIGAIGLFLRFVLFITHPQNEIEVRNTKDSTGFDSPPPFTGKVGRAFVIPFLLFVCALPVVALAVGTRSVDISYGRLLFPALTGFAPLLMWGWSHWFRRYTPVIVLPLVVIAILVPLRVLPDAYPPLDVVNQVPALAVPVNVSTGDLTVLAYQLHTDTVAPGDDIRFSLYLSGNHPENPALYITLLDPIAGDALGVTAVYPGTAPTDNLDSGTIYHAPLRVRLNTFETPLSPRQIQLQLGWQTALSTDYLPMRREDGTPVEALVLNASTLLDRAYTVNNPQRSADVVFGDTIRLTGYDIENPTLETGETLQLRFIWQLVKQMPEDWVVTAQLLDAENTLVGQDDGDIPGYPTSAWRSGADVVDLREIPIPENTPAGTYRLLVGWYRLGDFARLSVPGGENDLFVIPVQIEVSPHGY